MNLLERLWPLIEAGDETPRVELKSVLDLSTNTNKAEFVKDVSALANTPGGNGYLVFGVLDRKEHQSRPPEALHDFICGVPKRSPKDVGALERQMNQVLEAYCNPPPSVGYEQLWHEASGKWIGVVTIPRSSKRPHVIIRRGEGIQPQDIWVRHGERDALCRKANRAELEEMFAEKGFTVTSEVDRTSETRAKPIALAIGLGGSIQGAVMKCLFDHSLQMPVRDYTVDGFVTDAQFQEIIQDFNDIKAYLTQQGVTEVHLFYKGPVTLAMALGSILSNWVPLKVYTFSEGVYRLQIRFDRRTVRGL
jgi:hypothetical protein